VRILHFSNATLHFQNAIFGLDRSNLAK